MFHVGQLVVCVEHGEPWDRVLRRFPEVTLPTVGTVYTIREAFFEPLAGDPDMLFLRLVEIVNPPSKTTIGMYEAAFACDHFRPLDDNRIAVFRQLLVNPPREVVDA